MESCLVPFITPSLSPLFVTPLKARLNRVRRLEGVCARRRSKNRRLTETAYKLFL